MEALDENTMFPKNKLEEIIAARDELNQILGEKDAIIQEQGKYFLSKTPNGWDRCTATATNHNRNNIYNNKRRKKQCMN